MKPEDHKAAMKLILENAKNPAEVSDLLAQLTEDNQKLESDYAVTVEQKNNLEQTNEQLRAANMRLFEKVGVPETVTEKIAEEKEDPKPDFSALFDEEGNLK